MPPLLDESNRQFELGMTMGQEDFGNNMLVTTAGSQQIDQKYWLDRKTGMSYRINVYTPQAQLTSIKDLMIVPVGREQTESSDGVRNVQLLGNLAKISAIGTPGAITHARWPREGGGGRCLRHVAGGRLGRDTLGGADMARVALTRSRMKLVYGSGTRPRCTNCSRSTVTTSRSTGGNAISSGQRSEWSSARRAVRRARGPN